MQQSVMFGEISSLIEFIPHIHTQTNIHKQTNTHTQLPEGEYIDYEIGEQKF